MMPSREEEGSSGTKTSAIEVSEIVVRQIKEGGGEPLFFDETRDTPPAVHWSLFRPSRSDVDGLSLIRLRHRANVWAAFRAETPDQRYRLAHLLPSSLRELARIAGIEWLTFSPSPDNLDHQQGEPWAHCVVADINRRDYDNKLDLHAKKRIDSWAKAVSNLVTLVDITGPYPPPDLTVDSYRPTGN